MRILIVLSMLLLFPYSWANAQLNVNYPSELDSLLKLKEKPILIFIKADWCKYCKLMEESTLEEQRISKLINESLYFIEMNSEMKEKISLGDEEFEFISQGLSGKHELALELGSINGMLALPTICLLNKNGEIIFQQSGYLSGDEMEKLLTEVN